LRIDYRWGDADAVRIQALAKELVGLQPDVLVAHSTPSAKGLLQATRSIPIVFLTVAWPGVGRKLVAARRKHYRLFGVRVLARDQVGRGPQADRARHSPGHRHV